MTTLTVAAVQAALAPAERAVAAEPVAWAARAEPGWAERVVAADRVAVAPVALLAEAARMPQHSRTSIHCSWRSVSVATVISRTAD